MADIPEVRISFGELLYDAEAKALAEKFDHKLEEKQFYFDKTYEYWQAWHKQEEKILLAMQEVLGVSFYKPVMDVVCVPHFIPKSVPLIMNFKDNPERFVDVLTHELCHVLLTDNNKYQEYQEAPEHFMSDDWRKMFGDEHSHNTLVHIPVHAICKYIWEDVLESPERVEADIADSKTWKGGEDYIKSWDYVNAYDHREILNKLKASYHGG